MQESVLGESRACVLVNISMPCHHLALHRNPLNSVFYNSLRVCKTSFPLTSLRVLAASGGEKGVVVIDGNIPGLWANTLRGKLEIMTKIFFDMLIKCQTTMVNVLQMVYFQSKVE